MANSGMKILEKDLEQVIYESESLELCERGMCVSGKRFRQLRIGNYGIADLVTVERNIGVHMYSQLYPSLEITIYELKQYEVGVKTFLQAIKYARGIQSYLSKRKFKGIVKYHIKLVGKSCENSNIVFFPSLCGLLDRELFDLSIYTYRYDIDGLKFKHVGDHVLKQEGF